MLRKTATILVLFILTIAFCACASTSVLKNNASTLKNDATTEKYNYAMLFNLTPQELEFFLEPAGMAADFTDEQKSVELFVYDVENNLPAGISFNPKNGKVLLDFETYLFFVEFGYEDGQLVTYVRDIKSIGKEPYAINEKKDVCSHKTALFSSKSGALVLYACEVKGSGLLKRARWVKVDLSNK